MFISASTLQSAPLDGGLLSFSSVVGFDWLVFSFLVLLVRDRVCLRINQSGGLALLSVRLR